MKYPGHISDASRAFLGRISTYLVIASTIRACMKSSNCLTIVATPELTPTGMIRIIRRRLTRCMTQYIPDAYLMPLEARSGSTSNLSARQSGAHSPPSSPANKSTCAICPRAPSAAHPSVQLERLSVERLSVQLERLSVEPLICELTSSACVQRCWIWVLYAILLCGIHRN